VSEEMSDSEQVLEATAIDVENTTGLLGPADLSSVWKMPD
jgi:hypothetical protein